MLNKNRATYEDINFKIKVAKYAIKNKTVNTIKTFSVKKNTIKAWIKQYKNGAFERKQIDNKVNKKITNQLEIIYKIQKVLSDLLDINLYKKLNKLRNKYNIPIDIILNLLRSVGINISEKTLYRRFHYYKPKWIITKNDIWRVEIVKTIWNKHQDFGYRRVYKYYEIARNDPNSKWYGLKKIGINKIQKIMSFLGIQGFVRKSNRTINKQKTKKSDAIEDKVKRRFQSVENIYGKNKVFYTDVTFHSIFGIKFYQSTILEATTRRIIDVKFSFKNDTELIMRNMKGFKRQLIKDNLWKDNLIMHSDHGSVYFSKKYQKWAYKNKITISMGRTYSCSDNVIIETFHSLIKKWKYKLRKKFTSFKNYLQKLIYWCSEYNYLKTQTKSNFYYQPLIKIFKFFTNFSKKV
ncbi:DDE-type integrase/transposase/recombinase [Mycoplasma leachii]|uniref:DDE-type integrase/transposase/recombinase n=1 Tax=Mycoplasma leachii TaxID=2105 RepID=UPI003DA68DCD